MILKAILSIYFLALIFFCLVGWLMDKELKLLKEEESKFNQKNDI